MNDAKNNILIVDDDQEYAIELKTSLMDLGYIEVVNSISEFGQTFSPYKYDLILLDLRLETKKEGLFLLDKIRNEDPLAVVIIISAFGDIPTAVEAISKGATTFLEKGAVSQHEICAKVRDVLQAASQGRRIKQLEVLQEPEDFVGEHFIIQRIKEQLDEITKKEHPGIIIKGEPGTGKSLVAKMIHNLGARKKMPMIVYTPGNQEYKKIGSDIFGYEENSPNGKKNIQFGYFEKAHRGIFLLNDIVNTSSETQNKINKALINKNFSRFGSNKKITVDVQTIITIRNSLEEFKAMGKFREDLYYTLTAFPQIHMPPLRERGKDIEHLATYFLNSLIEKGRVPSIEFSKEAFQKISSYHWPLNVIELKFVVERAAIICAADGVGTITERYLFIPTTYEKENSPRNIDKILAVTELNEIEKALIKTKDHSGSIRKCEASMLLYGNRYSMPKRIKKRMADFPDLTNKYPVISKHYCKT